MLNRNAMHLYVLYKKEGHWTNGSSETVVRALCNLIDLHEELVYTNGRPAFINSKFFLSVSHSEKVMVIAIASQPIGIDLEKNKDLKPEVIQRLNLDQNKPLIDWCQREATIKLFNDPDYLLKKAPEGTFFRLENVYDAFTCVVAAQNPLPEAKIYHLDENAL